MKQKLKVWFSGLLKRLDVSCRMNVFDQFSVTNLQKRLAGHFAAKTTGKCFLNYRCVYRYKIEYCYISFSTSKLEQVCNPGTLRVFMWEYSCTKCGVIKRDFLENFWTSKASKIKGMTRKAFPSLCKRYTLGVNH